VLVVVELVGEDVVLEVVTVVDAEGGGVASRMAAAVPHIRLVHVSAPT